MLPRPSTVRISTYIDVCVLSSWNEVFVKILKKPDWDEAKIFFFLKWVGVFKATGQNKTVFSFLPYNTVSYEGYGITGYGVSGPGIQNQKDFCIEINLPKGNY